MPGEVINTLAVSTPMDDPQDPSYVKIRELVYRTCGIYHSDEKMYLLVAACGRRIQTGKAQTGREYLELLTSSAYRDAELRELLNEITIGETCLFRSQPQLNALQNVILPELVAERGRMPLKKIKIWSAGCSTGEEPYTLAMFLAEQIEGFLKGWAVEIPGVDLNEEGANLVRYQNAYTASAQVATVIDSLLETTINMVSSS